MNKILIYVLENCIYDPDVKNNTSDDILSFYEGGKLYGALEKDTQICGNYSALVCALCKRVNLKANYIVDNNLIYVKDDTIVAALEANLQNVTENPIEL